MPQITSQSDPRIARLATELDITVRRLQWMQAELGAMQRPVAAPVLITQAQRPVQAPRPQAQPRPVPPPPPVPFPAPAPARPARPPVFTVARVLAGAGVLVTLIGVALLLVLAAQAGLLGPAVRVGLGTALAAGLLGAALWLHRRPGGRIGSAALAATGIAAAYLDTVAVTGIYEWVPPVVGLTLSGLIALGGLALAQRWRSQWLGIALYAPVHLLAPPLAGNAYLLGGFTLILAIASIGVSRPAAWPWLHVVRSAGTSLTLAVLALAAGPSDALPILGATVLGAVVGLLAAADPDARAGRSWALVAAGIVSSAPVLLATTGAPDWAAAFAALALVAAAVALGLMSGTAPAVRGVWFGVAAFAALIGALVATPSASLPAVVLALGVGALVAAGREPSACWAGAALGGVGLAIALEQYGPTVTLLDSAVRLGAGTAPALATAALALALAVVAAWRLLPQVPEEARNLVGAVCGVAALGAATALFANVGWALGGAEGARWGHGVATVAWITTGAYLLLQRRRDGGTAGTVAGLALIAGAVAKLFLFDLAALDGAVRVIAFLLVGITLLGVGAAYAARADRARRAV
ncbi:Predicted membrane protein (plasmid) [Tsukamurella tyrosinosolvens]|uniref:Predicted membrane protein n=1 Tax=Tsukamurella tyrosinosolvens TaxID=57704 RepID=A0A1H4ZKD5_TSUTY|nr:DUF2339 domain-containing protein [Tsukamurella tyrosinosolvens]KXO95624.1 hypothetical protein AXK58_13085 [Tsukamurella tyrosinosolvens]SED29860.1 Predicted membrane protein [Tsukamurella tyrosinosolvens]VEI01196.1 Predicted membrane protein [Tsukamurella tyrosinosolvens]